MRDYHCCATCRHIRIARSGPSPIRVWCQRLGYETKTRYQFNCWDPRPDIVEKMTELRKDDGPSRSE